MSFQNFVSSAPKVLFWLGWLLAVVTFVAAIMAGNQFSSNFVPTILLSLAAAANALLVPWIAAAILWRIDRYLDDRA